jgi:hypothetical protein
MNTGRGTGRFVICDDPKCGIKIPHGYIEESGRFFAGPSPSKLVAILDIIGGMSARVINTTHGIERILLDILESTLPNSIEQVDKRWFEEGAPPCSKRNRG